MRAATRCRSFAVMKTIDPIAAGLEPSPFDRLRVRVRGGSSTLASGRIGPTRPLSLSLSKGEGRPGVAANDTRPGLRLRRSRRQAVDQLASGTTRGRSPRFPAGDGGAIHTNLGCELALRESETHSEREDV